MCEGLSYEIINISAVNQAVFCYYEKFAKIIIEKKTLLLAVASKAEIHFLNSFKKDLAKHIYINLGVYKFLNIHIFNWYKALYSASIVLFGILILSEQFDGFLQLLPWCIRKCRQLCLQKHVKY